MKDNIKLITSLGFGSVLLLMFVVVFIALAELKSLNRNMSTLVEETNAKIEAAATMRDAIRLRAISLQAMQLTDDPRILRGGEIDREQRVRLLEGHDESPVADEPSAADILGGRDPRHLADDGQLVAVRLEDIDVIRTIWARQISDGGRYPQIAVVFAHGELVEHATRNHSAHLVCRRGRVFVEGGARRAYPPRDPPRI